MCFRKDYVLKLEWALELCLFGKKYGNEFVLRR